MNDQLLEELNQRGTWFHARKTRPIWAKFVDKPCRVQSLEGELEVPAGSYVCRGAAGEFWPQNSDSLLAKYAPTGSEGEDGWRKFEPRPDAADVMAIQVDRVFQVWNAQWGQFSGKPGDYLVKRSHEADDKSPEDMWIVDRFLFEATYERVRA